ncbi:MAG: hypothetical protein WBN41_02750 [Lysobacterales bacterium]
MGTSNIPVQLIARLTKASIVAVVLATLSSVQAADMTTDEVVTPTEQAVPERSDTVTIEIPVRKGLEYKLLMEKYAHLEYEWSTDGEELYFDFHGEPRGDTTGYFESFAETTSNNMKGSLTTPFAGSHGWYWKNETDAPVIVTLSIKGNYILKP